MVKVVSTSDVLPQDLPSKWELERAQSQLLSQGLIEPLCVYQDAAPPYQINKINRYDSCLLLAANALNWPTVIIVKFNPRN